MRQQVNAALLAQIALLLVLGLSGGGCSEEREPLSPAGPSSDGPQFLADSQAPVTQDDDDDDDDDDEPVYTTSRWISRSNGGEIAIGDAKVYFPKYSLPQSMTITLTIDPEHLDLFVQPAGTPLQIPMKVTFTDLDESDGAFAPALSFFNEQHTTISTTHQWNSLTGAASSLGRYHVATVESGGNGSRRVRWLEGPGYRTQWITVAQGGWFWSGRFAIVVPAGAMPADGYLTVRDTSGAFVECELTPHGISFLQPVELYTYLSGTQYEPYEDWTTWWHNEAADAWEDQGGSFDGDWIHSYLDHFSTYRPGRAASR